MFITRKCPITNELKKLNIPVTQEQLKLWHQGALIQDAMPNLSADDREFLISGITPDVWNDLYGEKDELLEEEMDRLMNS